MASRQKAKQRKKRIMHKFKISEISAVDRPAQSGALATIMKRNTDFQHDPINDDIDLEKAIYFFPLSEDKEGLANHISKRASELDLDKLLPTTGELAKLLKREVAGVGGDDEDDEDIDMPKDKKADDNELTAKVDELTGKLEKAMNLARLNDDEKAFYKGLDNTKQEVFLNKTADERAQELELAKAADPVIFTSKDGTAYYKSDDDRLVQLAKQADEDRSALMESQATAAKLQLRKRAETELENLPGTIDTRVAILKAVDAIEDETERTEALKVLKAQNAAFSNAMTSIGHNVEKTASGDANDELVRLTEAYVKEHPETGYYEAYEIVSKAHPKTYAKAVAG